MERTPIIADIERRHAALGQEIENWLARARADASGLGLHRTQLETIARAQKPLAATRQTLLNNLAGTEDVTKFGDAYVELLEEIVGAGELWRLYRAGVEQHSVSPFKDFVHEATLIAEDISSAVFAKAEADKVVAQGSARAPAMVYLDPALSPAAAGRYSDASDASGNVRRFRAMRLAVPLVLVPADQATSVWLLALLAHEVGHNLDQDLGRDEGNGARRTLTRDLQQILAPALSTAKVPDERVRRWHRWSGELLADLFGVASGGEGFVSALSHVLLPLAPASRFAVLDQGAAGPSLAPHPPPWIRQLVLVRMARLHGMSTLAGELDVAWKDVPRPPYVKTFENDVDVVADTLWELPCKPDGASRVRTIAATAVDTRFDALVSFLAGDSNQLPSARYPEPFPRRLVPSAAELARRKKNGGLVQDIHTRAMSFLKGIRAPQFLAGAPNQVDALAGALRFSRAARGEP